MMNLAIHWQAPMKLGAFYIFLSDGYRKKFFLEIVPYFERANFYLLKTSKNKCNKCICILLKEFCKYII